MSRRFDVAVVGGGAAGLAAAIGAARRGGATVVCERLPRLGKKLLATGGGRCNLLSEDLSPDAFTSTRPGLVAAVFERFGKEDIRAFFRGLGLELYAEGPRVFPVTNQASSVLQVLELEIRRLGVDVETDFEVAGIETPGAAFSVRAQDGRTVEARAVILAGGGKAYPALGSNGSAYPLARIFGHRLVPPVPSAVPVLSRDGWCHILQGQKIRARAAALAGGAVTATAEGDALFTAYGLSGTAVLDVSESLSIALHRENRTDAAIVLDLVPFLTKEALAAEFLKRMKAGWAADDLAAGLLPGKFAPLVRCLPPREKRDEAAARALASALKEKRFEVHGTRGWNEAEFTSGGVDAREVDSRTLESTLRKGLYLAGEILDVQGPRGGFNLAWAWASGAVAGRASVSAD
jgi:predicted Rossmann fold flavoprotein